MDISNDLLAGAFSRTQLERTLRILFPADSVFEVRCLNIQGTRGYSYNAAGYFNDIAAAVKEVERIERQNPKGIYVTLNQCNEQHLARANNELIDRIKTTTCDREIQRRHWLLVDADGERISGISATDEELAAAHQLVIEVADYLHSQYWYEPTVAMSGNGWHLLYPIDLPNDDESNQLVKRVLEALAQKFQHNGAKVDTTVFNAARITKLYGTMVRKGQDTPERPHRRSELRNVPDYLKNGWCEPTPVQLLKKLADQYEEPKCKPVVARYFNRKGSSDAPKLDAEEYLRTKNISFRRVNEPNGYTSGRLIVRLTRIKKFRMRMSTRSQTG